MYTNWHYTTWLIQIKINKLTERTKGRVIKKGKKAQQTSKISPHPLLLKIIIHHYMYMTCTSHITNNFWTLTNKRPNWFSIIGFSLLFVTIILVFFFIFVFIFEIVFNTLITEQKDSKGLVYVTEECAKYYVPFCMNWIDMWNDMCQITLCDRNIWMDRCQFTWWEIYTNSHEWMCL